MKWKGRRQSGNLEDQRGMGNKGKLAAGGGVIAVVVILLQLFGGETGQQLAPIIEQVANSQTSTQQVEQRDLTSQEVEMGNYFSKKNVKKKPLLTAKEKKAAKQAKKEDSGSILGKH